MTANPPRRRLLVPGLAGVVIVLCQVGLWRVVSGHVVYRRLRLERPAESYSRCYQRSIEPRRHIPSIR